MWSRAYIAVFLLSFSSSMRAETAICSIAIQVVNTGATYVVEAMFDFEEGDIAGRRKSVDVPGANYSCMLTFFGLRSGTMVSCQYGEDLGETFFQSDRTTIDESNPKNTLAFRHEGTFVVIRTECA